METDGRRICVVGAGPGGLTVGRALRRAGLAFDIVERHCDVGGIWDIDNPGSPMYASAHFISSSGVSHFHGAPMPADYPDYPDHRRILAYIRAFASAEGLYRHVQTSSTVTRARRVETGWLVSVRSGGETHTRHYSHLVCATGTTWSPKSPSWASQDEAGIVQHASTYRHPSSLRGKRVLVVGAGNSGCDIACDAARNATTAHISMRRGYHFVPKHLFGMPADVFCQRSAWLPMWLRRRLFEWVLRMQHGDLTRLGLPAPDHRVLESHPILNDQLLHHLRHGDIAVVPDVRRLDGHTVHFADGSQRDYDLVLCATGYRTATPHLEPGTLPESGGRPDLFLNIFAADDPTLMATGFLESNSGLFKLFDLAAHVIAQAAAAGPAEAHRLRGALRGPRPDLSGGVRYVASERHANYVNIDAYRHALHRFIADMGWPEWPMPTSAPVPRLAQRPT